MKNALIVAAIAGAGVFVALQVFPVPAAAQGTLNIIKPNTLSLEKFFVTVKFPNGGEIITFDENAVTNISFDYGGPFDPKKSGRYFFKIELWSGENRLGDLSYADRYPINHLEFSKTYKHTPGEYWVPKGSWGMSFKDVTYAPAGSDYRYKVILMEAITLPGEPTQYKNVAEDFTDGAFSLRNAAQQPLRASQAEITGAAAKYIKIMDIQGESSDSKKMIVDAAGLRAAVAQGKIEKSELTGKNADAFEHIAKLAVDDEHIKSVETSPSHIVVRYSNSGKLLGFIPVRFVTTNTADTAACGGSGDAAAGERVKVTLPWYSFLIKKNFSARDIGNALNQDFVKLNPQPEPPLPPSDTMENIALQTKIQNLSNHVQAISNILKAGCDAQQAAIQNMRP